MVKISPSDENVLKITSCTASEPLKYCTLSVFTEQ